MPRISLLRFVPLVTLGFSLLVTPIPTASAGPLGRIHDRIFGSDDDDKKKKKKKDDDDDDDHRDRRALERDHRCWDLDRNGYCDADRCGQRMRVTYQPSNSYSYERRYERSYVEPAPRSYVEQRTYVETTPRTYAYSSRSLEVDVQLALRRRGYYRGPVDGDIGPGTRSAIRDYQFARGLAPTGRIDRDLIRSLGL